MEDIQNKAMDDELNKSQESIEQPPRKFIGVPKSRNVKRKENVRVQCEETRKD